MDYLTMISRLIFSIVAILVTLSDPAGAFTIDGVKAPERLPGVPIGSMGAGVFNFLPFKIRSREYCRPKPPTEMEPAIMVYTDSGGLPWSTQAIATASGIGMDCINREWKSHYATGPVVPIIWSSPVFMMMNGTDAPDDRGWYRYMNPCGVFAGLFINKGLTKAVVNKKLWIKPNIPFALTKKLVKAPLRNPVSCETHVYSQKIPKCGQTIKNSVSIPFAMKWTGNGKSTKAGFSSMGDIAAEKNSTSICVSDSCDISPLSEICAKRHDKVLFKSSGNGIAHLLTHYLPCEIVEVYNLMGELVIKSCVVSFRNGYVKIPKGLYTYRIKQVH